MAARFIDAFDVILLDQGRTFMFENDRFGAATDYWPTYRELGGTRLAPPQLHAAVEGVFARLLEASRGYANYDAFPSIAEVLRAAPELGVAEDDWPRLDELFGRFEVGTISAEHIDAVRTLAATHRLGIVSNIWAGRRPFEENLRRHHILDCFLHRIWSSDLGCVKPSRRILEHALRLFAVPPERALFVGDSPVGDIDAAKALGLGAAWVQNDPAGFPPDLRPPDLIIARLSELLRA